MAILTLALIVGLVAAILIAARISTVRHRALRRLYDEGTDDAASSLMGTDGPLGRWLLRAGYRGAKAPTYFIAATAAAVGIGVFAGQFYRLALLGPLLQMVANAPGNTADVLAAVLQG